MESASVQNLYKELLNSWNNGRAKGMADLFLSDGVMIGYDGSIEEGADRIFDHLHSIFENHQVASFVSKVKEITFLNENTALLRSIASMIPPGQSEINSKVNTHHTLVAVKEDGRWKVKLFQNTPALFHGRPELVEQMTKELKESL